MNKPTDDQIRAALVDRLENGDNYASDSDWIGYLSDGLDVFWSGERLPNGDRVTNLEPELEALIEGATADIARQCQAVAITELTKVAARYRDRVANRNEYRRRLEAFPVT